MLTERDLIREISPNDRLYSQLYFWQALSAIECIDRVVAHDVKRILDLPCGHGRVMRALSARFPDAEIVGCDVLDDGVDFCAETFGATPVYTSGDPSELEIDGKFDLIWCGSLLTHLPPGEWTGFMDLFKSLLGPDGTCLITTHGRMVASKYREGAIDLGLDRDAIPRLLDDFDASGIAYEEYRDRPGYGISVSAPWWVVRHLERESLRLVTFAEKGWSNFQDVYAVTPDPLMKR